MTENQFSLVPIEVIQDKRLTLEQTRVLIALFSFRNKVANTVWPSRAAIAERTGMHASNISSATTALVALGWLVKDGLGGHSKATRYTLCSPDINAKSATQTVAQSATVADQATVAQSATQTVAQSATTPLADQATRKEQTIEQSNEHINTSAKAPVAGKAKASAFVLPGWIPADTWAAFMETRKAKKARSTDYALGLIVKSLERFKAAGHDPVDVLDNSIKAGWSDVYAPKTTAAITPGRRTPTPENFAARTYVGGKL